MGIRESVTRIHMITGTSFVKYKRTPAGPRDKKSPVWTYLCWLQCDICNWTRKKKLKKVDTFPSWSFSSITCDKFRKDHGFVNIEDNDICMECQIKLGINM